MPVELGATFPSQAEAMQALRTENSVELAGLARSFDLGTKSKRTAIAGTFGVFLPCLIGGKR